MGIPAISAPTKMHGTRVIEYTLDDPGVASLEVYRLITSELDPVQAPAHELAVLYAERQEFEFAEDEFKTHLRGRDRILRSQRPEGVQQEICGYFLAHYAIRVMMHDAALQEDIDPQRLSFTHTVNVLRRKIIARRVFSLSGIRALYQQVLDDILHPHEILPPQRLRVNPRVIKRKMSKFPVKRSKHRSWPQPTRSSENAVRIHA